MPTLTSGHWEQFRSELVASGGNRLLPRFINQLRDQQMKTIKLSTISSSVSIALNVAKYATEVEQCARVVEQTIKVKACHGAARKASVKKLARIIGSVEPVVGYAALVKCGQTKGLVHEILTAAHELDRPVGGKRREWGDTIMAKLIKACRAGVKFRNREVAERVFLGNVTPQALARMAEWAEIDAVLERCVWHSTGFGRFRDVEPALCVIRTSSDGALNNSVDNEGEVSFSTGDDPEIIAEYLAASGMSPEDVAIAIEDLAIAGKVTIAIDHNVKGESGRISTGKAFDEQQGDEADHWLNGQQIVETDVLYHRPKDGEHLLSLLEDSEVVEWLTTRGAAVWADNLPAMVKATREFNALAGALYDEDTELPVKGRKAVRKVLTKLAIWTYQAGKEVEVKVGNDRGGLTASGKYRPGEVTRTMSVAERAHYLFIEATDTRTQVSKDIESLQRANEFWNTELPTMLDELKAPALRASQLMKESLLLSGLDIPLDSVAFDQVATALVNIPSDVPEGLVVKPVIIEGGEHLHDDVGRALYWVTPFGDCWLADGALSDNGRTWAKFVVDHRANTREIDNSIVGLGEAAAMLDTLL